MALVAGSLWLSVTLIDSGANETTRRLQLQSADLAEAAIDSAAAILALGAVTDAVIKSYHYYQEFVEDALALPAAGVQIENVALLEFQLEDPTKTATWALPAPDIGIFSAATGKGSNIVDVNDVALLAFTDLFTDGADPTFFISDGEQATQLNGGKRIHRASRRG